MALRRDGTADPRRQDLDRISMLDWLLQKRQTPRAIDRFWRQVLVSAINEDLDRMAARHGFQVFWLGFLARADSYEMGVPAVPLARAVFDRRPGAAWATCASICARPVERIDEAGFTVAGERRTADLYICALPFERLAARGSCRRPRSSTRPSPACTCGSTAPSPPCRTPPCSTAPCSGCSTRMRGRYLQLVVSASRDLTSLSRAEIIDMAVGDLRLYFQRFSRPTW